MAIDDILWREVRLRRPFRVIAWPWAVRATIAARSLRSRGWRRMAEKGARWLFRSVHHRTGVPARGALMAGEGQGARRLSFDAANTHFLALVLEPEPAGYEAETLALIDLLVGEDDLFIDVGANWGFFSLAVALRPGFRGRVIAFEPLPEIHADLCNLAAQARLESVLDPRPCGLSERDGKARLVRDRMHSALARIGEGGDLEIEIRRLDGLGLPPAGLIKIDAEGHEIEVLRGATETLAAGRSFVVFESLRHAGDPERTLAPLRLLEGMGYRLFEPVWLCGPDDRRYLALAPDDRPRLALLPIEPAARFAQDRDFNVLACPPGRLDALRALFAGQGG